MVCAETHEAKTTRDLKQIFRFYESKQAVFRGSLLPVYKKKKNTETNINTNVLIFLMEA